MPTATLVDVTVAQLLIRTPLNPTYAGMALGVKFDEGQALIGARAKPNRYGYTLEQLAIKFVTDLQGYEVTALNATGQEIDLATLRARLDPDYTVPLLPGGAAAPTDAPAKPARKLAKTKAAAHAGG